MAHLTISRTEILFLREEVIAKYAETLSINADNFQKELTSYIEIYRKMADVITDRLADPVCIQDYLTLIKDSPSKLHFKKLFIGSPEEQKHFLRFLQSAVSSNSLRKLLFNGPKEQTQSYMEDFIYTCYLYAGKDRHHFITRFQENEMINPGTEEFPANGQPFPNPGRGTVTVFKKDPYFSLQFVNESNSRVSAHPPLAFYEEVQQLNRANLDPGNMTITSKVQAEISLVNGQWVIDNKSQLGTTFIVVNKPTVLQKGDVIAFGNQRFVFDAE